MQKVRSRIIASSGWWMAGRVLARRHGILAMSESFVSYNPCNLPSIDLHFRLNSFGDCSD